MLRDLVDRYAYRYRLWSGETRSRNLGAGQEPPEISPRNESAWQLISRFVQLIATGVFFLWLLYLFATRTFPDLRDPLLITFWVFAAIWCGVGLFILGGELLVKYSKSDDDDKSI